MKASGDWWIKKHCSGCNQMLARDKFAPDRVSPNTMQSKCRDCKNRRARERRAARVNQDKPVVAVLLEPKVSQPRAHATPPLPTNGSTLLLAHEMVRLEQQIRLAALEHRWTDADELDDIRSRVQQTRSSAMRRAWADAA